MRVSVLIHIPFSLFVRLGALLVCFLVEREACRCRTISVRIILNCCENELRDRFHKWLLTLSLGFLNLPLFFVLFSFSFFYYYDTYYFLSPRSIFAVFKKA